MDEYDIERVEGLFFTQRGEKYCCLCGNDAKLTREHKIKASQLAKEFGREQTSVGRYDDPSSRMKLAQSVKSKHLKFETRICELCNSSRTQPADRAFDEFAAIARKKYLDGDEPREAFDDSRFIEGQAQYLSLFRYFAKLLSCHISEIGAPIPKRLSSFAINQSDWNCVWLEVKTDQVYGAAKSWLGADHQYAAHGGLAVCVDKKTGRANSFHSSITVGPIQYVFYIRLKWLEKIELSVRYPKFSNWYKEKIGL